jgi:hypothetical protein
MSTALTWWQLPGPAHLIAAVADDLDRGRCAVVALPAHAPVGFYPAIQQALRSLAGQPQRWRFPHLPPLTPPGGHESSPTTPQAWLHRYLPPPEAGPEPPVTPLALAQRPGFGGYRVLLQPSATDAPAWLAWLADYQKALPQVRHAERTLFLLILAGEAAVLMPPPTAGLCCHAYRQQAGPADLALHLQFACPRPPHEPPLLHRMRLSVAAALAPFDVETAVALATAPLPTLLQPLAWLLELAQHRAWPAPAAAFTAKISPPVAKELWAHGIRVIVDGHACLHPAALAQHGDAATLATRIWEGQLPVLLPFLEQRRQALLSQLAERLRPLLPYQNASGETLRRLEEIELGDLFRLCVSSGLVRLEAPTRAEIRLLRDCRNWLAHLEPVPEAEVLALAALQQRGHSLAIYST